MIVGFTGTQSGMTLRQQGEVARWLNRIKQGFHNGDPDPPVIEFHHGMCVGADAQAHAVAYALFFGIHGHPSTLTEKTMEVKREQFKSIMQPMAPLERNHDIVDLADVLIAAPRERKMVQRSGTWATWRYAQEKGKTIITVWP